MCAKRGQSLVEYAVSLAVIIAALLAVQIYLKRGVAGKLRTAADSIGEQYAPRQTTSSLIFQTHSDTVTESKLEKDKLIGGGKKADVMVTTTTINDETTQRTGTETVDSLGTDLWD
ncbi:MAG: hypothetical protein HY596_01185 [Candidatus Omnitrophica bacterium]|nr:hypothetical protein [Candidatus Omnitrophota bacterium]